MVAIRCRLCFFPQFFFFLFSILFADPVYQVRVNQPGMLVIEVSLDTLWVDEQHVIHTRPAMSQIREPGFPQIPYTGDVLIGLPADVELQVMSGPVITLPIESVKITPGEQAKGIDYEMIPPSWDGEFYPQALSKLEPAGMVNDYSATRFDLYPVRLSDNTLEWRQTMTVQITWASNIRAQLFSEISLSDLRSMQENRSTARILAPDYQYSDNLARIVIDTTGWYQVTYGALVDSGIDINNADPASFQLLNHETEIMLYVDEQNDGQFDPGDRFIFLGEKNSAPDWAPYKNNFYTDENVYWLTWGGADGSRYITESAYPGTPEDQVYKPAYFRATLHIEKDNYFSSLGQVHIGEIWDGFDHYFMDPPINAGTSVDYSVHIPFPRSSNQSDVDIIMEIQGITTSWHNIQFLINDQLLGGQSWIGQASQEISGNHSQEILSEGVNELTVLNLEEEDESNRYDQVYLNWLNIQYDRFYKADSNQIIFSRDGDFVSMTQFEISGFETQDILIFKNGISRLSDFIVAWNSQDQAYKVILQDYIVGESPVYHVFTENKLLVPKSLESAEPLDESFINDENNYIILVPDSFQTAIDPLAVYHDALTVDVDNIYRRYSGGVTSPYAIKDFLKEAWTSWSLKPEFVLIGMQGKSGDVPFIPAMKFQTYRWGAAATDHWYADLEGNDFIADLSIGRLPAANIVELETMVEKTLHMYNMPPQTWQNRALMIGGYELAFKDQSEELIDRMIQQGHFPKRLYVDLYSEGGPFYGTTDMLLSIFEQGVAYMNFLGHGGGAVWGDRSLFTLSDVEMLTNGNRLPFVTSMTCFTGSLTNPNALGRRLLELESGGVGCWFGSGGIGWIINDYLLLEPLHRMIFSDVDLSIGEMINHAKAQYLLTNTAFPDIAAGQVHQFNLIGDPAMKMPFISKGEITPSIVDPEPGETLTINIGSVYADSLTVQLFNLENIPATSNPVVSGDLEITIPNSFQAGPASIVASYKTAGNLVHDHIPLSISGSLVEILSIEPQSPTAIDSIQVLAMVQDRQGIDSVGLWLADSAFAIMIPIGENLYTLSQRLPLLGPGITVVLKVRAVDSSGAITWSDGFQIDIPATPQIYPDSLYFSIDESITLVVQINNLTAGPGSGIATVERQTEDSWELIASHSLETDGLGFFQVHFPQAFIRGTHSYRVVTHLDDIYSNTADDTLVRDLETTAFWVTPELGTTNDLIENGAVGLEGIDITIAPGVVVAASILQILSMDDLEILHQPDLTIGRPDSLRAGLSVYCDDALPYSFYWRLDGLENDSLIFVQYDKEMELWFPMEFDWNDSSILVSASGPNQFGWVTSDDVIGPVLEATVNGQQFMHNSYVGTDPVITINAQDRNGVNPSLDAMALFLNGSQIPLDENISVNGKGTQLGIELTPTLAISDTSLHFLVTDAAGNQSDTLRLKFIVSSELDLKDYGNFPNPFKDLTRFTYELTETVESFSLELYTVAGRRIRTFDENSALTDLDPRVGAFHEIIWDGKDDWGNFVANGVYFYRYLISNGDTRLERIGKAAKAR